MRPVSHAGQSCTNEKRLDFKHTSKATSSRFADENDGVANGRRRVEGDSRIFGLHSWKGRVAETEKFERAGLWAVLRVGS